MVDVELADMKARKRGAAVEDPEDRRALLSVDESERSIGSFSKEPKASAASSASSSHVTVCIAVSLIVVGMFMVLSGRSEGRLTSSWLILMARRETENTRTIFCPK